MRTTQLANHSNTSDTPQLNKEKPFELYLFYSTPLNAPEEPQLLGPADGSLTLFGAA